MLLNSPSGLSSVCELQEMQSGNGRHGHRKCLKGGLGFEKIVKNVIKFEPEAHILCNENIGIFIVYIG